MLIPDPKNDRTLFRTAFETRLVMLQRAYASLSKQAKPGGLYHYVKGDAARNAASLRSALAVKLAADAFRQQLQEVYLSVNKYQMSVITYCSGVAGDEHEILSSVSYSGDADVRADPAIWNKELYADLPYFVARPSPDAVTAMKQSAAARLLARVDKTDKRAGVFVHHPQLMSKVHRSRLGKQVQTATTLNVDMKHTFTSLSNRLYSRPAAPIGLNLSKVEEQSARHADRLLLIAEKVQEYQDFRSGFPVENYVMACFAEVMDIDRRVTWLLRTMFKEIYTNDVQIKYSGFGPFAGVVEEARPPAAIKYAPGIVMFYGMQPSSIRAVKSLHRDAVRHYVRNNALSIRPARFSIASLNTFLGDVVQKGMTEYWRQGQRFADHKLRNKLAPRKRKETAVT